MTVSQFERALECLISGYRVYVLSLCTFEDLNLQQYMGFAVQKVEFLWQLWCLPSLLSSSMTVAWCKGNLFSTYCISYCRHLRAIWRMSKVVIVRVLIRKPTDSGVWMSDSRMKKRGCLCILSSIPHSLYCWRFWSICFCCPTLPLRSQILSSSSWRFSGPLLMYVTSGTLLCIDCVWTIDFRLGNCQWQSDISKLGCK